MVEEVKKQKKGGLIPISFTADKYAENITKPAADLDIIYDLDNSAQRRINKFLIRGTLAPRQALGRMGAKVFNHIHPIKEGIAKLAALSGIPKSPATESAHAKIISDVLASLNNDLIYVLSTGTDAKTLNSVIDTDLDLIRQLQAFSGSRQDVARAAMLGSNNSTLPKDLKAALKNETTYNTQDNFEEIYVDYPITEAQAEADAKARLEKKLADIKTSLELEDLSPTYFGRSVGDFAGGLEQPDDPEEDTKVIEATKDDPLFRKGEFSDRIIYIYNYQKGVDTKYIVVDLKIAFLPGPSMTVYTPKTTPYATDVKAYNVALSTISAEKPLPIDFLEKAKKGTYATHLVIQWEHLVSLATYNIVAAANMAKQISLIKMPEHPEVIYATRVFPILERIAKVSMNVDSLFTALSDPTTGALLNNTGDPLTNAAIMYILTSVPIDYTDFNWVQMDGDSVIVKTGVKRVKELVISGGELKYDDMLLNGMVGIWGPKESNLAKGAVSKMLLAIAKTALTGDLTKALSDISALEYQAKKPGSDSFITSLAIASGLGNLGVEPNSAKAKTKTITVKGGRLNTPKKPTTPTVVPTRKKHGNTGDIKTKVRKSSARIVVSGSQSTPTIRSESLVNLINANLSSEIQALMIRPRLEKRTGRFADSAKVTSASSKRILVEYMSNPYDIFSKDRGASPWNTRSRDPVDLISLAVRSILAKNHKKYAKSVSIGRG